MNFFNTAFKCLNLLGGFATIGVLLAMGFLLLDVEGKLSTSAEKLRNLLKISALTWFIGVLGSIIFTLASWFIGSSVFEVLDPTAIRSFLTLDLGSYLAFEAIVAFIVFICAFQVKKILTLIFLVIISLAGLVAPVFLSHAASGGSHSLVVGSLVIHVIGLSLWVGGILAIAMLSEPDRAIAVPRFSQLALWAAIAVVISGVVNAWARLNFVSAWNSTYAYITGSPDRPGEIKFDPALSIVGIATPPKPTWSSVLFSYEPNALIIGILVVMVALYVKGVIVLTKRGDKWPVGRTISFALGIAAVDFATSGGLGLYAHFSFSYHMIAHMLLAMIAPIGLVLGAPMTLALRTLPQGRTPSERGVRGTLLAALHSKIGTFYTNPIVALLIFDGSLFALYFTDLFANLMQSHIGHLFMTLHFLAAGFLFFFVVIGVDPNPRRIPHLVKIVILFAAMSIHAFFSVALMSTSTLIDKGYFAYLQTPWLTDLLADQKLGGSIGWAMGEIPILIALVATFINWLRDDTREANRIDRNIARQAAMGQPDDLANYNQYLQKLAQRDKNES